MTHALDRSTAYFRITTALAPVAALLGLGLALLAEPAMSAPVGDWAVALHGGAGSVERDPERLAAKERALREALAAAGAVLSAGGDATTAAEAAVIVLENSPLFNAGRGGVFSHEGHVELDASIMRGADRAAGAVAGVRRIKNPVRVARAVMERSRHVFLIGEGAERFAAEHGLELVDPEYFRTEDRWRELERARRTESFGDTGPRADDSLGTVGAVVRDTHGNLAAATSTGGITNKRWGRVGDTPVIGAGTYADRGCAVSATGHGEYFIRLSVARTICALVEIGGRSMEGAVSEVIRNRLPELGGTGGVIAIDAAGTIVAEFNTAAMYRAMLTSTSQARVEFAR